MKWLPAVTAHQRDRGRRSVGAGAAEIVAATLTSKCPSQKKAWWKRLRPDWGSLLPPTDDEQSPGPEQNQFVSEPRVKEVKSLCVKLKNGRALLVFRADRGGLAPFQL